MSFDWAKNFEVAQAIEQLAPTMGDSQAQEAIYRAVINRTYYAVMKISFTRFSRDYSFQRQNVHEQVRKRLESYQARVGATGSQVRIAKQLHNRYKRLRAYRNEADYEGVLSGKPGEIARLSIEIARKYLQDVEKI